MSNWLLNIPTPETVRKIPQLRLSNWLLNIPTPIKTAGREINYTKTEELARNSGFCREFLPNSLQPREFFKKNSLGPYGPSGIFLKNSLGSRELRAEIPSKTRISSTNFGRLRGYFEHFQG